MHIYPMRLTDTAMVKLAARAGDDHARLAFWKNLAEGYRFFEDKRRPARVRVDAKGRYRFR